MLFWVFKAGSFVCLSVQAISADGTRKARGSVEGVVTDLHTVIKRQGIVAVLSLDDFRARVEDENLGRAFFCLKGTVVFFLVYFRSLSEKHAGAKRGMTHIEAHENSMYVSDLARGIETVHGERLEAGDQAAYVFSAMHRNLKGGACFLFAEKSLDSPLDLRHGEILRGTCLGKLREKFAPLCDTALDANDPKRSDNRQNGKAKACGKEKLYHTGE